MKTKRKLDKTINIPENIEINLEGSNVIIKGPKGGVQKRLANSRISMTLEDKKVLLKPMEKKPSKKDKTMIGTFRAHILNMIRGVEEGYEYKLKICSGHFPMSVSVDGDKVVIKNFLGEKIPRKSSILAGAHVKVDGDIILVSGIDKEAVSQTAARIEQATRITNRDRRVFQDGCYIISKAGKPI